MEPTGEQLRVFHDMGDVNDDGIIDAQDQALLTAAYGKSSVDADWASYAYCDLNHDGVIDLTDASIFGSHYGTNIRTFFNLDSSPPNLALTAGFGAIAILGGLVLGYFIFRKRNNPSPPFSRPI